VISNECFQGKFMTKIDIFKSRWVPSTAESVILKILIIDKLTMNKLPLKNYLIFFCLRFCSILFSSICSIVNLVMRPLAKHHLLEDVRRDLLRQNFQRFI
jgi:hypothetical protein